MSVKRIAANEWKPSPGIRLSKSDEAIVFSDRNLAIRAGPGAGKTELLAQRASHLLQTGVCPPPRRILAISFKVDAATNLRNRVRERCGDELARRFVSLTFDAFAKNLLDRYRAGIEKSWRPSGDYTVDFPGRQDWREFLDELADNEENNEFSRGFRSINSDHFTKCHAFRIPIGKRLDRLTHRKPMVAAALEWWKQNLAPPSRLTFPMIRRLSLLMIETNPKVRRLLQATYSHVFLDEFQDTTQDQYDLLQAIFADSEAVLTAVGDKRQAIMGWAGAMKNPFETFGKDFNADVVPLVTNHRSNRAIVDLINAFQRTIWDDADEVECARKDDPVPELPTGRAEFDTQVEEAETLASFIREEVESGALEPEEFALLVRVRANQLEQRLEQAFAAANLLLRNDARELDGFTIQDLVKEPLFDYLLASLKLAARVKSGAPYQTAEAFLAGVLDMDLGDPRQTKRLQDDLRSTVNELREVLETQKTNENNLDRIINIILSRLPGAKIRAAIPALAGERRLEQFLGSFKQFLQENTERVDAWSEVFESMEGKGQVRLMTIHRSKGLEFHTVFFLDLNDESWFTTGEGEDNAFFVALSRARERVYFLNSNVQRRSQNIKHLNRALDAANVPFVEWE